MASEGADHLETDSEVQENKVPCVGAIKNDRHPLNTLKVIAIECDP